MRAADLERVRDAVSAALTAFLTEQRRTLSGMAPQLTPVVEEVCALAEGGKRLRPLFAYWGWRGATGTAPAPAEDDESVLRAVAALEFVHAARWWHDDVMGRRLTPPPAGRPPRHR
ncbi:polyprenyl synthetase, partial [Modestobacter sp. VKM Ac-2676]